MELVTESVYQHYLSCLLKGDRTRCSEIVVDLTKAERWTAEQDVLCRLAGNPPRIQIDDLSAFRRR